MLVSQGCCLQQSSSKSFFDAKMTPKFFCISALCLLIFCFPTVYIFNYTSTTWIHSCKNAIGTHKIKGPLDHWLPILFPHLERTTMIDLVYIPQSLFLFILVPLYIWVHKAVLRDFSFKEIVSNCYSVIFACFFFLTICLRDFPC